MGGCQYFYKKMKEQKLTSLNVQLFGSLAKTGKGHGTDIAVMLGLSGYNIETIDVKKINDYIAQIKTEKQLTINQQVVSFDPAIDIEFIYKNLPKHPNALTFMATLDSGKTVEATFY